MSQPALSEKEPEAREKKGLVVAARRLTNGGGGEADLGRWRTGPRWTCPSCAVARDENEKEGRVKERIIEGEGKMDVSLVDSVVAFLL